MDLKVTNIVQLYTAYGLMYNIGSDERWRQNVM